jgi:hypothetical protein
MRCCVVLVSLLVQISLTANAFSATHTRGGYTLDNQAYTDQTVQVSGPVWSENSPGWVNPSDYHCLPVIVDWILVEGLPMAQYPSDMFGFVDLRPDIVVEVRFVNNAAVNLLGADILIVQLDNSCPGAATRTPGGYLVAVADGEEFGAFFSYPKELAVPMEAYPYAGCGTNHCLGYFAISSIEIDLSDFGVEDGAVVSKLRFSTPDQADPVAIAAIHSTTPLPVRHTTWGEVKSLYR